MSPKLRFDFNTDAFCSAERNVTIPGLVRDCLNGPVIGLAGIVEWVQNMFNVPSKIFNTNSFIIFYNVFEA